MVHFGARWYDAQIVRWLSKDPILLAGGLNLYAFCSNDPINFSDPLGLAEGGLGLTAWGTYMFGQSSYVRDFYSSSVAGLESSDIAGRTAVKELARSMTPQPMRAIIEAQRPSLGPRTGSTGSANVSNSRWNAAGKQFGRTGNGFAVANMAVAAVSLANAPQGQKLETLAAASGATIVGAGGGIGGAATGAWVGSLGGPLGTVIGAIVGCVGGSIGGGMLGAEAGRTAYELNTPVKERF